METYYAFEFPATKADEVKAAATDLEAALGRKLFWRPPGDDVIVFPLYREQGAPAKALIYLELEG